MKNRVRHSQGHRDRKFHEVIAFFNYIRWGTADPDKPDPVTGLSRRELHLIHKSWAKLYAKPIDSGMTLFVKLFRAEPSTQDLFVTIKDQLEERFNIKPQFKAHVLGFMSSINMAETSIMEPAVVIELKLGRKHRNAQVKQEYFPILTQVLVDTLKNDFHAKDDVITAWSKILEFLYKPLFETLTAEE